MILFLCIFVAIFEFAYIFDTYLINVPNMVDYDSAWLYELVPNEHVKGLDGLIFVNRTIQAGWFSNSKHLKYYGLYAQQHISDQIFVDVSQSKKSIAHTFIHEVGHRFHYQFLKDDYNKYIFELCGTEDYDEMVECFADTIYNQEFVVSGEILKINSSESLVKYWNSTKFE